MKKITKLNEVNVRNNFDGWIKDESVYINNNEDYLAALREVSKFFDNQPEPNSLEGERFDLLISQIEAYETKNFKI